GFLERRTEKEFRSRLIRRKLRSLSKRFDGAANIADFGERHSEIQVRGSHLWIKFHRPSVFRFRVCWALQRGVRVSELEMRDGVVRLLREVFLILLRCDGIVVRVERRLCVRKELLQRLRFWIVDARVALAHRLGSQRAARQTLREKTCRNADDEGKRTAQEASRVNFWVHAWVPAAVHAVEELLSAPAGLSGREWLP